MVVVVVVVYYVLKIHNFASFCFGKQWGEGEMLHLGQPSNLFLNILMMIL